MDINLLLRTFCCNFIINLNLLASIMALVIHLVILRVDKIEYWEVARLTCSLVVDSLNDGLFAMILLYIAVPFSWPKALTNAVWMGTSFPVFS